MPRKGHQQQAVCGPCQHLQSFFKAPAEVGSSGTMDVYHLAAWRCNDFWTHCSGWLRQTSNDPKSILKCNLAHLVISQVLTFQCQHLGILIWGSQRCIMYIFLAWNGQQHPALVVHKWGHSSYLAARQKQGASPAALELIQETPIVSAKALADTPSARNRQQNHHQTCTNSYANNPDPSLIPFLLPGSAISAASSGLSACRQATNAMSLTVGPQAIGLMARLVPQVAIIGTHLARIILGRFACPEAAHFLHTWTGIHPASWAASDTSTCWFCGAGGVSNTWVALANGMGIWAAALVVKSCRARQEAAGRSVRRWAVQSVTMKTALGSVLVILHSSWRPRFTVLSEALGSYSRFTPSAAEALAEICTQTISNSKCYIDDLYSIMYTVQ